MSFFFKHIGLDDTRLEKYMRRHTSEESPLLKKLYRETYLKIYHPRRSSDHFTGRLLAFLSCMIQPQNILEIGTFTGYGTLCLAEGLLAGGSLHTIEKNDEIEPFCRKWLDQSPWQSQIHLHIGDALQIIPDFNIQFDLAFIDGEKSEYSSYYKTLFPKIKPGGFILADNVLWSGKVLEKQIPGRDHYTRGIMEFNELIRQDQRVEQLLLPVFDGMMLIRKIKD
ncbi:MAG: O-methyltransferase [Bacteroidales bacterium]|nr:O-methyltransferase [Bacteroidales bacterium]